MSNRGTSPYLQKRPAVEFKTSAAVLYPPWPSAPQKSLGTEIQNNKKQRENGRVKERALLGSKQKAFFFLININKCCKTIQPGEQEDSEQHSYTHTHTKSVWERINENKAQLKRAINNYTQNKSVGLYFYSCTAESQRRAAHHKIWLSLRGWLRHCRRERS